MAQATLISEAGLYKLIAKSEKLAAKAFDAGLGMMFSQPSVFLITRLVGARRIHVHFQ